MTTARNRLIDPAVSGFYHCVSRCVRRAWLCGVDPYDGRSYEHRRAWVEQRVLELVDIFAVGVYAYAVMSNHVHLVLRIDPSAASSWTEEDVARRWVRLFPVTLDGELDEAGSRAKEQSLLGPEMANSSDSGVSMSRRDSLQLMGSSFRGKPHTSSSDKRLGRQRWVAPNCACPGCSVWPFEADRRNRFVPADFIVA